MSRAAPERPPVSEQGAPHGASHPGAQPECPEGAPVAVPGTPSPPGLCQAPWGGEPLETPLPCWLWGLPRLSGKSSDISGWCDPRDAEGPGDRGPWGRGHLGTPASPTPSAEASVEPQDCRPLDGGVPAGGGSFGHLTSMLPLPRTPCSLRPLGPRTALNPALWTQVSREAGGLAARMAPPCPARCAWVGLPCPHSGHSRSALVPSYSQEGRAPQFPAVTLFSKTNS